MTKRHCLVWSLVVAVLAAGNACDRAVEPIPRGSQPAVVGSLTPAQALDIDRFVTDSWLERDSEASCAHGPLITASGRSSAGLRVVATKLPDGSLLRMRGIVGDIEERGAYIEIVRDWPHEIGMRVGTVNTTSDTLWVLRYGLSNGRRVTDDRPVADAEAAATLGSLRRQFAALDCPARMNHKMDHGTLIPLWNGGTRTGWEWREAFPPRSLGRSPRR